MSQRTLDEALELCRSLALVLGKRVNVKSTPTYSTTVAGCLIVSSEKIGRYVAIWDPLGHIVLSQGTGSAHLLAPSWLEVVEMISAATVLERMAITANRGSE